MMLIWKFIDERSEEFQKHLNFVKNIKPKKNFKYDKIFKKKKKNDDNKDNENDNNDEKEEKNDKIISLESEEDEKSDESEEETNDINNEKEIKYYSEFEKKILKGRFILEKKEQFVTNSKVVMCEITQNIEKEIF